MDYDRSATFGRRFLGPHPFSDQAGVIAAAWLDNPARRWHHGPQAFLAIART
jgi:hypothetical protein